MFCMWALASSAITTYHTLLVYEYGTTFFVGLQLEVFQLQLQKSRHLFDFFQDFACTLQYFLQTTFNIFRN